MTRMCLSGSRDKKAMSGKKKVTSPEFISSDEDEDNDVSVFKSVDYL